MRRGSRARRVAGGGTSRRGELERLLHPHLQRAGPRRGGRLLPAPGRRGSRGRPPLRLLRQPDAGRAAGDAFRTCSSWSRRRTPGSPALPDDASLPAPFGNLGPGAIYYAHSRDRFQGETFLKQGYLTLRRSGLALTVGRFDYSDGLETVPADPDARVAEADAVGGASDRTLRLHPRRPEASTASACVMTSRCSTRRVREPPDRRRLRGERQSRDRRRGSRAVGGDRETASGPSADRRSALLSLL